jgi:hypothetical protein
VTDNIMNLRASDCESPYSTVVAGKKKLMISRPSLPLNQSSQLVQKSSFEYRTASLNLLTKQYSTVQYRWDRTDRLGSKR